MYTSEDFERFNIRCTVGALFHSVIVALKFDVFNNCNEIYTKKWSKHLVD